MPYEKIMACLDFSEISKKVLEVAGELAHLTDAQVLLIHVVERDVPLLISEGIVLPKPEIEKINEMHSMLEEKARHRLKELAKGAEERWGFEASTQVLLGEPFELILDKADDEKVDLIVVGSHSKKGVKRLLLGSVSEKVAMKARCSVLVVR